MCAVQIRLFKPEDLDQVVEINLRNLPEHYPRTFFLEHHRLYPKVFLVAEDDGKIVGYIMCRIERHPLLRREERVGHVVSIAVIPEYRRRKIGTSLMLKAMEGMVEYNAKSVYLEVRVSNISAINLYKKLGFSIQREIKGYYSDGENAYVMSRELP